MPIQETFRQQFVNVHSRAEQWLTENFDSFVRTFQETGDSGRRVFERYTCVKKNPKNPDFPFVFGVILFFSLKPEEESDFYTYVHSTTIGRDLRTY